MFFSMNRKNKRYFLLWFASKIDWLNFFPFFNFDKFHGRVIQRHFNSTSRLFQVSLLTSTIVVDSSLRSVPKRKGREGRRERGWKKGRNNIFSSSSKITLFLSYFPVLTVFSHLIPLIWIWKFQFLKLGENLKLRNYFGFTDFMSIYCKESNWVNVSCPYP